MIDAAGAARGLLPDVAFRAPVQLRSGERTSVHRVTAHRPGRPPTTVIVKQFHEAGEGWVRETAALSVLPDSVASTLVAAGDSPPVIVTGDLGPGESLADALLADDPDAAAAAVRQWAEALAAVHAGSRDLRAAFEGALAEREGELPVAPSRVRVELADAVRVLDEHCASLGVRIPAGALEELRGLADRLGGDRLAALTPADTCPDNNVRTPDGLVLIDFEGAQWRHIAWDVAYLFVPWPSCWCSWRMPDDVAADAFTAYRAVAGTAFPEVLEASFRDDVAAATVGWALTSTAWFLDAALGSDPPNTPDQPTPARRAMILHRLALAAGSTELPGLAGLAGELRAALHGRWGDAPLAYARAFVPGR